MLAIDIAQNSLPVLKKTDKVGYALDLMANNSVFQLPVVDAENKFLHVISFSDLWEEKKSQFISNFDDLGVKVFIKEEDHVFLLLTLMINHDLTLIPILNEHNEVVTSACLQDISKYFSEFASVNNPGGIMVLEVGIHDYSMSEIARIAESNNAVILSSYITTPSDSANVRVNLKFNVIDLTHVIASYERFGYKILSYHHQSHIADLYLDRYQSLMNFLGI